MKGYSEMKALLGTAAVVVIITCGYFVYNDLQSKAAIVAAEEAMEERASYISCRIELQKLKETLQKLGVWEGKTHEERLKELQNPLSVTEYSPLLAVLLEVNWEKCGPI